MAFTNKLNQVKLKMENHFTFFQGGRKRGSFAFFSAVSFWIDVFNELCVNEWLKCVVLCFYFIDKSIIFKTSCNCVWIKCLIFFSVYHSKINQFNCINWWNNYISNFPKWIFYFNMNEWEFAKQICCQTNILWKFAHHMQ